MDIMTLYPLAVAATLLIIFIIALLLLYFLKKFGETGKVQNYLSKKSTMGEDIHSMFSNRLK